MTGARAQQKKANVVVEPTESGKPQVAKKNYTGYFYREIDKLWKEIMILQEQNNELRASISGGP